MDAPPGVDPLTRLPNRERLLAELEAELVRLQDAGGSVAVLLVDLDGFRRINRDRGSAIGDQLLFAAGRRLRAAAGAAHLAARAGGDEFVVLAPTRGSTGDVIDLASTLLAAFDDPFDLGGEVVTATVSIGIVLCDEPAARPASLLADAEAALDRDRSKGRRLELFDRELRERIRYRAGIGRALTAALRDDDVRLLYQPIFEIDTGRLVAIEALARWRHPERGLISPELFVPIADETGAGDALLGRVLEHAGDDFAPLAAADPDGELRLAVNVSAAQLACDPLLAGVRDLVERSGVEPGRIVVEISESALSGAAADHLERVSELRRLGVGISLDDFGTASTSIAQLRSLPVDQIKLDRTFVGGLGEPSADGALAAGVLTLARTLGIEVVAEGIETQGQLAHLFALGYRLGQGYLLARPATPEGVLALLEAGPLEAARLSIETKDLTEARERFRAALLAGDAKLAEAVVADAVAAGIDPIAIQGEVIGRALRWIDAEWEAGRLRAADEHLAAAICERQVAAVLELGGAPRGRFQRPGRNGQRSRVAQALARTLRGS